MQFYGFYTSKTSVMPLCFNKITWAAYKIYSIVFGISTKGIMVMGNGINVI